MKQGRCEVAMADPGRPGAPAGAARRTAIALTATLALFAFAACEEDSGDTIVVNGLDCGLIHQDVAGDWLVTYTPGSATLVNCYDPFYNNTVIDVTGLTTVYANPAAFASPSGAGFNIIGEGPNNRPNELMASVEADSCLSLVQTWEEDDIGWVQCFGTMDLVSNFIAGICDSFDLDTDDDGVADTACGLDHSLLVTIATPP
jgi:hypothetical protein